MGQLVQTNRDMTNAQMIAVYNRGVQKVIPERTTCQTLKRMGYSSKRPCRVPLLSVKDRKMRLQSKT